MVYINNIIEQGCYIKPKRPRPLYNQIVLKVTALCVATLYNNVSSKIFNLRYTFTCRVAVHSLRALYNTYIMENV